ncbi:glycosyltransferase family 2 protein [Echinicola jeungdonensis]|uniref:Glycosyltransferase family 2 protein n=1 Tax=Echinicola jeungdonensis TaxID=709343 RepID=A0ABV5J6J3_9BACT|nr:glycosyltransferase family 2 protein [Echinicola jeungdonensis]MDN3671019.1 glycosyltransferase family 2 protein [Echinicola jeungdonensis]
MPNNPPIIDVIIPANNEEQSIGHVVREIPGIVRSIVVVNNNSTDTTAEVARQAGAEVVDEPIKGYGRACLRGIAYLLNKETPPGILVFLDGDYSDYPGELEKVVAPIIHQNVDLVIGSRELGIKEPGAMTFPQVFGNWLSTRLMFVFYGVKYSDLGPFRAIKWEKLQILNMVDQNFGWTIEMQIKAAKHGLQYREIPVNYKKRIGTSKVSGTVKGTFMAGYKIILTIFKYL